MGTPERIYELVKTLPSQQVDEVLDFVEFLRQKDQSKAALQPIPQGTLTGLRGIAKPHLPKSLDFRQAAGLGQEVWSDISTKEYIQKERESWD
jgi:hypothetical protein